MVANSGAIFAWHEEQSYADKKFQVRVAERRQIHSNLAADDAIHYYTDKVSHFRTNYAHIVLDTLLMNYLSVNESFVVNYI